MRQFLLAAIIACGFFYQVTAQTTESEWEIAFRDAFIDGTNDVTLVENPLAWLERNMDTFSGTVLRGESPIVAGHLAAALMLEWDFDIRSGVTFQEAQARFKQSSRIVLGSADRGSAGIALARVRSGDPTRKAAGQAASVAFGRPYSVNAHGYPGRR